MFLYSNAQPPELRRVCRSGVNNILFFNPSTDTCTLFQQYYVHARNGETGLFQIIDSIPNKQSQEYIHTNANPGAPTLWFYFIQYVDSCGPQYSMFSDTVVVDIVPPDTTLIDSVSIDIANNRVQIGWKNNTALDFLNFFLYRIDGGGIFTELTGGTRDTNWIDAGVNPRTNAFTYDLLSRDSCTNPQIFGINPHRPMLLNRSVDTCNKTTRLFWSAYIGWPVRTHYIYLDTGTGFFLRDSVSGNSQEYIMPIRLGVEHRFYVRAFADSGMIHSSSSNDVTFTTRLRIDPDSVWLQNVSFQNNGNLPISLKIGEPRPSDILRIDVLRTQGDNNSIVTIPPPYTLPLTWNDLDAEESKYSYQVKMVGLCSLENSESNNMSNILLSAVEEGNDAILTWENKHPWEKGVLDYELYRAVVDNVNVINYTLVQKIPGNINVFRDIDGVLLAGREGLYYLIKAIQNSGSPWGGGEVSYSNSTRVTGNITVFVPNAFRPSGVNRVFKPSGMFIDYRKSTMQIYDRWGGMVANLQDITDGWDGRHMNGNMCAVGVYIYEITIFDLDGKEQKKRGTVTLLN
jgi:gliding motility-associated-like protein